MPKRIAQRRGEQPRPRRGAHQREFRQRDLHRAGRRTLADDEIELVILHGRIEDFLHLRRKAVNLVDEEHVALFEIGEDGGEVAGLRDHRAGGGAEAHPHFARHDLGERSSCQGRAGRRTAHGRAPHPRAGAWIRPPDWRGLRLPDEIGEPLRTQGRVGIVLGTGIGGHQTGSHAALCHHARAFRSSRLNGRQCAPQSRSAFSAASQWACRSVSARPRR